MAWQRHMGVQDQTYREHWETGHIGYQPKFWVKSRNPHFKEPAMVLAISQGVILGLSEWPKPEDHSQRTLATSSARSREVRRVSKLPVLSGGPRSRTSLADPAGPPWSPPAALRPRYRGLFRRLHTETRMTSWAWMSPASSPGRQQRLWQRSPKGNSSRREPCSRRLLPCHRQRLPVL